MVRISVFSGILALIALGFSAPQGAKADTITFDELGAQPCVFASTGPLREQYATKGVHFTGPAALDGGAILDQCGNFGVPARSGLDFLAFNRSASMNNGGVPQPPQTVTFDAAQTRVSIFVAGGSGSATFKMDAFNSGGSNVGSTTVSSTGGYVELAVSAAGIVRVVIDETSGKPFFVMDDLSFDGGPPCSGKEAIKKAKCKKGKLKVKTVGGNPGETVTVNASCGTGSATVKANGSATVKISPCSGSGTASAKWTCGATGSVNYNCASDRGAGGNGFSSSETFVPSNHDIVGGVKVDRTEVN